MYRIGGTKGETNVKPCQTIPGLSYLSFAHAFIDPRYWPRPRLHFHC